MPNIVETQINRADIKALFKDASSLRDGKPGLGGSLFKGLRKDKINIDDLQKAWKDDGFSDDTADIARILHGHGFSPSEINKVFAGVFGKADTETGFTEPVASPAIQKIADYAKKEGFTDEIIEFMRREYQFNESIFYPGKVVIEDVRRIFSAIVHEERSGRVNLIKKDDITHLGRGKK